MTDQPDLLQAAVRRNIKVLMAIRGIDGPRQLGRATGKPENWIAQKQSGRRRWHLDDLPAIASALGVHPSDLLREVADLVAAAGTTLDGSSPVTGTDTTRYSQPSRHLSLVPPLVGNDVPGYPDVADDSVALSGVTPGSDDADAA